MGASLNFMGCARNGGWLRAFADDFWDGLSRGLAQLKLSSMVGAQQFYITQLESGRKNGPVKVLKKIASALGLGLDDLVGQF